jgi:hypothetical protein
MSGNVAVIVPVWLVMVSVTLVNVTLTRVSVMLGLGHSKVEGTPTAVVSTSKVPLPCRVSKVSEPTTVVVNRCSPLGSLLPLGVMQPTVTFAVADRVAVALVPAPQTSPVAVKNAVPVGPVVFVAVTSSVVFSQTCRPPVCVTVVGATASAAEAGTASSRSAKALMMPILLIDPPGWVARSLAETLALPCFWGGPVGQALDDRGVGHRGPAPAVASGHGVGVVLAVEPEMAVRASARLVVAWPPLCEGTGRRCRPFA